MATRATGAVENIVMANPRKRAKDHEGWFTYSFDTGAGVRRRGRTESPERRKWDHAREFPEVSDWRQWSHPTRQAMIDHERKLHKRDK